MRCVHCGKEVKNNVIFCIHCGRPVKREYSRYSCEIYDDLSLKDKILNLVNNISSKNNNYENSINSRKNITKKVNIKEFAKEKSNSLKQKGSSLLQSYNDYTKEESSQNDIDFDNLKYEGERNQVDEDYENTDIPINFDDSDSYVDNRVEEDNKRYNYEESDFLSLDDLKNIKNKAKQVYHEFRESSHEEQRTKLKVIGIGVIAFIFIMSMFVSCLSYDDDNYYVETSYDEDTIQGSDEFVETDEEYIYTDHYNFPENPVIIAGLRDNINKCPLGSEELIVNYLKLIYEDKAYIEAFYVPLHSLEEIEPYIEQIEQIEADYNNDPNYQVYGELIYIKDMWQQFMQPIYETPDAYEQWEIENNLEEFSEDIEDVCEYYVENKF